MNNRCSQLTKHQRYNNSIKGIARQLRANHGYDKKDSEILAELLTDDWCRCFICGIPVWWIKAHKGLFPSRMQEDKMRRRLTVDHINPNGPSVLENSRPLCAECNILQGANRLSDEQVLSEVRNWWRNKSGIGLRFLFWLNIFPKEGGVLFRNKYMEVKEHWLNSRKNPLL